MFYHYIKNQFEKSQINVVISRKNDILIHGNLLTSIFVKFLSQNEKEKIINLVKKELNNFVYIDGKGDKSDVVVIGSGAGGKMVDFDKVNNKTGIDNY